jgi:hypothetical protein
VVSVADEGRTVAGKTPLLGCSMAVIVARFKRADKTIAKPDAAVKLRWQRLGLVSSDLDWQRAGLGCGVLPAAPPACSGENGLFVKVNVFVGWMTLFIHRADLMWWIGEA